MPLPKSEPMLFDPQQRLGRRFWCSNVVKLLYVVLFEPPTYLPDFVQEIARSRRYVAPKSLADDVIWGDRPQLTVP